MRYAVLVIFLFTAFAQGQLVSKVEDFEPFYEKRLPGVNPLQLDVSAIRVSPDGTRLAVVHEEAMYGIAVYDTTTRKKIWGKKKIDNIGQMTGIKRARFTKNGSLCLFTKPRQIWQKPNRKKRIRRKLLKTVSYIIVFDPKGEVLHKREVQLSNGSFSLDGTYFYTLKSKKVNGRTRKSLVYLNIKTGDIDKSISMDASSYAPVFSNDMTRVCVRTFTRSKGTYELKVYDLTMGKRIRSIPIGKLTVDSKAFSKDGSSIFVKYTIWRKGVADGHGLVVFHIQRGKRYKNVYKHIGVGVSVSSKSKAWGRLLLTNSRDITVMDVDLDKNGLTYTTVFKTRIKGGYLGVHLRDNVIYFISKDKIYKATLTEMK